MAKKLEWSMVDGAIRRCQEKYKQHDISKGFPFFILELLLPNINEDLEELITDDGNIAQERSFLFQTHTQISLLVLLAVKADFFLNYSFLKLSIFENPPMHL